MIELVRQRRSIRSFTTEPVAPESVAILVETALRAPTSRNLQPCQFVVVDDRELLGELAGAKAHGSAFLRQAPLGIVVCADPDKSDVWVEDSAIAAIMVQLAAQSLGLGSCWIQIRLREHDAGTGSEAYVAKLLGLPAGMKVLCMIAVGHPSAPRPPVSVDELDYRKVKRNRYETRWDGK